MYEVGVDEFVDLLMTIVVGWGKVEERKKVGISSLSKKVMIRQARPDYALVGIYLFDVLELSIRFCQFVGLIFVRDEHEKSRFLTNQNSPRLSDCQNAFVLQQCRIYHASTTPS